MRFSIGLSFASRILTHLESLGELKAKQDYKASRGSPINIPILILIVLACLKFRANLSIPCNNFKNTCNYGGFIL